MKNRYNKYDLGAMSSILQIGKRMLMLGFSLILLIPLAASAQDTRTITGKVTDDFTNEGLPGTSITVKGTSSGTTTDLDGNFSISASSDDVLVFSYVGYETKEIPVGQKTTINLTMVEDVGQLSEVVVVGYGTQEAEDVTGAVNMVKEEDFNKGAIPSPDNLIAGKVPGVSVTPSTEPGGGSNIVIRGNTSINNAYPLIVVDGVPLDNAGYSGGRNPLNFINPNDIESVTVLKDASAAAIYGSRAAAGVIIYTTKSGTAGKPVFKYDGFYSVTSFQGDFEFLSPQNFRAIVANEAPQEISRLGEANTVWVDQALQQATGQSHNLSFSGGNEQTNFAMSINHMINRGVVKNSENNITRLNMKVSSKFLNDDLRVTFQTKNALTTDNFSSNVVSSALTFDPTRPVYAEEATQFGGFWEWDLVGNFGLAPTNPVSILEQTINLGQNRRSLSGLELDYKFPFLDGLSFNAIGSADLRNGKSNFFQPTTLRNTARDGFVSNSVSEGYTLTYENYLKYKNLIPSIGLDYDVLVGWSFQEVFREQYGYFGEDLTTDLFTYNDPSVIDPDQLNPIAPNPTLNRLNSYFGRVNTSFKDRYLLTVNFRADGSTRFGGANQYGFFPSAALGWRLMEEDFLSFLDNYFTDLKVRFGYGVTGNQSIGDYLYLATYGLSTNDARYQFGEQYYQMLRPVAVDPDIQWEETVSSNLGFDFGLFRNRVSGTLDFYRKVTTDMLARVPVAAGTNVGDQVLTNIAEMENQGVELGLSIVAVDQDRFDWNIGFNAAYNVNEITQLNNAAAEGETPAPIPVGGISGDVGQTIQVYNVGSPIFAYRTYEQIYEGGQPVYSDRLIEMYVDQNNDGIINENDLIISEQPAPIVSLGFTSNATYGNFSLDFTLRGNLGNYVYNNTASANGFYQRINEGGWLNNVHESVLDTEFRQRRLRSDYYLENASFLRMDNITLSYNYRELNFVNARIYLTAQNLFTLSGYSGPNPEIIGGIDNNIYPLATTYIMGVNLTF